MSFILFESFSGVEHKINTNQITHLKIHPNEDKCILTGVNHQDARTLPNFEIRLACGKVIDRNTLIGAASPSFIRLQESQYRTVRFEIEELIRKLKDL